MASKLIKARQSSMNDKLSDTGDLHGGKKFSAATNNKRRKQTMKSMGNKRGKQLGSLPGKMIGKMKGAAGFANAATKVTSMLGTGAKIGASAAASGLGMASEVAVAALAGPVGVALALTPVVNGIA